MKTKAKTPEARDIEQLNKAIKAIQANSNPFNLLPVIKFLAPFIASIATRIAVRYVASRLNRKLPKKLPQEAVDRVSDRLSQIVGKFVTSSKK